jgi:hypothetical protein
MNWYECMVNRSRFYGTTLFKTKVMAYYHSLLNLDNDKLAIWNKCKEYYDNIWMPKINTIVTDSAHDFVDESAINHERGITEDEEIVDLFHFINQTIQDSGKGWRILDVGNTEAWDYKDAIKDRDNY